MCNIIWEIPILQFFLPILLTMLVDAKKVLDEIRNYFLNYPITTFHMACCQEHYTPSMIRIILLKNMYD